jgi:hypothetical protein
MKFLYPTSRQFPFDEVCERIVRELEARRWNVPSITVELRESAGHRLVSHIKSADFNLWFCRTQGSLPFGYNNCAAITHITIPKWEIHVHEDESGPRLYHYVGDDYVRDKETFMYGMKVSSKLTRKPKTYLMYKGECHCMKDSRDRFDRLPHTHDNRRPPLLVHNNDCGREYEPVGDEPKLFRTSDILEQFRVYLNDVVLALITAHPAQ